ncbi:aminotransferase class IV [Nocardia mexicana]|uniref:Branched-subunit amino acid aminotransferase/4-amino-4-deoxychorismate lyase n=1 Tax=Nocardia mexicana TaxID=279262 RepID=A0A370H1P8_9NOCA|nr:aminotransferase class IV [Nocardia mexicana]RDI49940.1 branched-subunit amino acid aminotransferase/4-amino-4-deoxychorismate lyase [Nocardia mexicana]
MAEVAELITRWRWSPGERDLRPAPLSRAPVVIDSWLVAGGQTVSPELHADRFAAGCTALAAVPPETTRDFLRAVACRIPLRGRWFPRVELIDDGGPALELWLRPAPPRGTGVNLRIHPGPDRRRHPTVKGPDLAWLSEVRQQAVDAGADEALLLAPDGRAREGATTALLWWRGEALCVPAQDRCDLLPSVTSRTILRMAAESGIEVVHDRPFLSELDGLETWMVNALHGIRPVRSWMGAEIAPGPAIRAPRWQARLDAARRDSDLQCGFRRKACRKCGGHAGVMEGMPEMTGAEPECRCGITAVRVPRPRPVRPGRSSSAGVPRPRRRP